MIGQYLSNTNENTTIPILQNFLELNKALVYCQLTRGIYFPFDCVEIRTNLSLLETVGGKSTLIFLYRSRCICIFTIDRDFF